MTAARRLAAILAADVVGYSRLMGEDEAGTARAVSEHREAARPIVASMGGRIVKTTGDGLLLEFPSVVAAVECAIAIQKLMAERNSDAPQDKRIVYRIGVNLGDVLVEGDDILGDGVNIAARLEGICEPGGVFISGAAYDHVRGRVDAQFVDLGEKALRNIARPMRVYRVAMDQGATGEEPRAAENPTTDIAPRDKPSIAVLPFQNMSDDPAQEYFADGMVEDIITGLSRIKWLLVIARNSSFTYKGKAVDVRQIGHELGVRYVLEGGVRKAGSRVRITAQLLEAETRAHLWADKYDGAVENVFDLQDQITDRVVGIVEPSLQRSEIERSRRKRPENLDAYDLYLRALPHMTSGSLADARIAVGFLEEALKLDPNYVPAHARLAHCHEIFFTQAGLDEANRTAALRHAEVVATSGTDDATALAVAAFLFAILSADRETAFSAIERALSLNPSCAAALYYGAIIYAFAGQPAAAISHANRALRLNPFDPLAFTARLGLGLAAIQEARYDESASHFAKGVQANSRLPHLHFFHAEALAFAGRKDEAASISRRALEQFPSFRIGMLTALHAEPTVIEKLVEGARLLGLPE